MILTPTPCTESNERVRDLEALRRMFAEFGQHGLTANLIAVSAVHHTLPQLIALGWLRLDQGRWTTGIYVPAGELKRAMENAQCSMPNAQ